MAKKKRRRPVRRQKRSRPVASRRREGVHLVTPEGDAVVFISAEFSHANMEEIRQILGATPDFDAGDDLEPEPDGTWQFAWFETDPGAPPTSPPHGRRVLATLTLTPTTLEVEAMSEQRLENCRRRLEELLGDRISLAGIRTKTVDEVLREEPPDEPQEPLVLPSETIAEIEEQMLRQWIDESIPALGGLTPRQAARTPEGRRRLEELLDYIERQQARISRAPGMFSPDYRKVKKMLGLE